MKTKAITMSPGVGSRTIVMLLTEFRMQIAKLVLLLLKNTGLKSGVDGKNVMANNDPAICPDCKGPMKPLFTGFYCPKDCDKPHLKAAKLKAEIEYAQALSAVPKISYVNTATVPSPFNWFIPPSAPAQPSATVPYTPRPDQCSKSSCRGQGKITHSSNVVVPLNHYECTICGDKWAI